MNEHRENESSAEQEDSKRRSSRGGGGVSSSPLELTGIVASALLISFVVQLCWPFSGRSLIRIFHFTFGLSLAVLVSIVTPVIRRGWEIYPFAFLLLLLDGLALATVSCGPRVEIQRVLLPMFVATPILITLESIKFCLGTYTKANLHSPPFFRAFQFKMKHLFVATTVLAMVIVFAQSLVSYFSSGVKSTHLILTITVVLLSVNALISTWAILGRTMGFRMGISLITAALFLVVSIRIRIYFDYFISADEMWSWISFATFTWVTSSLQLYLFRRQGYRFVRHRQ